VAINAKLAYRATALHIAVANKSMDILAELLKHKSIEIDAPRATDTQKGCTCLHFAADFGHLDMVKVLVEAGAKVDAQTSQLITPLSCAARNCHYDICKYFIEVRLVDWIAFLCACPGASNLPTRRLEPILLSLTLKEQYLCTLQ